MRLCPRQPADISLIRRRSRLPGGIGATPSGNSGKTYLASQYARIHARLLQEASPVIAAAVAQGRLKVVAAYYDLATGAITLL